MAEYIEREAFIEAVKDIPMWGSVAVMFADSIPAADVAPVVHGRWGIVAGTKTRRFCSVCAWDVPEYGKFYAYCPNCGAKMDGDKE